jgi:hypothetical protein
MIARRITGEAILQGEFQEAKDASNVSDEA